MKTKQLLIILVSIIFTITFNSAAIAQHFSNWSAPINVESISGTSPALNTSFNEDCPSQTRDGLSLFFASTRPGGFGGQDIWVAYRANINAPFGDPINLGATVNSAADDFCPESLPGNRLYFVSSRVQSDSCGGPDIYFTRFRNGEWLPPQNLGCHINSPAGENNPSYFEDENGNSFLYFYANRPGGAFPDVGAPDLDIYFSMNFGAAQLAAGINTPFQELRPDVRKDGREIVFDTNRPGTLGLTDIWTATRENTFDAWSSPIHLDAPINSPASETGASFSWDGLNLHFASNRSGGNGLSDNYVTTRQKLRGNER